MKIYKLIQTAFVALTAVALSTAVLAQNIEVKDAWIRSTVPGQKGTGSFMKIIAKDGAKLTGVSSPVAGVAEVHEMTMQGDVMKMRAIAALDLPAGKAVELKPGGFHVMLLDLKQPLAKDSTVPMTLTFKDANGVQSKMDLQVPVSTSAPNGAPGNAAGGHSKQNSSGSGSSGGAHKP